MSRKRLKRSARRTGGLDMGAGENSPALAKALGGDLCLGRGLRDWASRTARRNRNLKLVQRDNEYMREKKDLIR